MKSVEARSCSLRVLYELTNVFVRGAMVSDSGNLHLDASTCAHSYAGLCIAGRPRNQTKTFWTISISKKMIRIHSTFYKT